MKHVVIVIASIFLFSCSKSNEEKIIHAGEDKGFLTKCKEFFIEPEENKIYRKEAYLKEMINKYGEYENVLKFFAQKNNPYVIEVGGSIYKILDYEVDDAGSKTYNYEDENLIKYFYKTDDNYYIYSFTNIGESSIEFQSLRRIAKGFFKTEMHDLIFENGRLIKENLVGKYSTDFFEEDGIQKFKFSNKVDGDKVINTFNLGTVKDF